MTTILPRYKQVRVNGVKDREHRVVWKAHHGEIPVGFHVHHVNGDGRDNRIENLELLTAAEHNRLHKTIYPTTKHCTICGDEFTPRPTRRKAAKTCSEACRREAIRLFRLGGFIPSCGTESAYRLHLARGEEPCDECRAEHARLERTRRTT